MKTPTKAALLALITTGLCAFSTAPAVAQATTGLPSVNPFTQSLSTPTGRTNITTEATAKINAASRAPIAGATAAPIVTRPDMVWVPDRYVSVPGAPQGVLVPGHWEQRISEHQVYAPPLPVTVPGAEPQTIPAGVRPPADERTTP